MRRLVLIVLGFVLIVVPTACRLDADVLIDVDADGAGTVTVSARLDREAASKLGDPKAAIKVDDMRAAGWKVSDPVSDKETGEVTLSAVRSFASPSELSTVLTEIGGSSVFSGTKLQIADGFASTDYDFRTQIDLTGSVDQFSDPALKEALGGLALGRTPEQLKAEGMSSGDSATLSVTLDLPGKKLTSNGESANGRASWKFPLNSGNATSQELIANASDSQRSVLILIGAGAALLVVAVVLAGVAIKRARS
ncbi:MAG TPA: hypothetical protein VL068_01535 [Microthrixaceae bacterium]|nr:hypothetical protein [Microthrixaceae bacterium]